jgi:eukaryotic-like serine/threonine-protein kinase
VDTRWQQIKAICSQALDLDEPQRQTFLSQACADDPALRREVESILKASSAAPSQFDTPAADLAADLLDDDDASIIGQRVGVYRIDRRIGAGGMGTVYAATRCDGQFEQQVAVKLIRRRILSSESIRRFRGERQALASLNHPNIARLYDGGVTDSGVPFLVMEYVDGTPIDAYCRQAQLSPRAILSLFRTVCAAVQHVHQNLIVHRDLKPGNILVSAAGVPKLVDFGIAKPLQGSPAPTLEGATTTAGRGRPLTPAFASPEQIRGETVTTASDVYSLGVILYTLLTGQSPFAATTSSPYELERQICEVEPTRPSSVLRAAAATAARTRGATDFAALRRAHGLAGDIDAIVLKALRKEPGHRYSSVESLSEDIERYLSGLPVMARHAALAERVAKFVRRHRALALSSVAVVVAVAGGFVSTAWQARIAMRERDAALTARKQAEAEAENARVETHKSNRVTGFLQDVLTSADPSREGRDVKLVDVLDRAARNIDAEYGHDPETQSAVLSAIGNTYFGLGRYAEAQLHLTRSLDIQTNIHRGDHPDVAHRLNDLASLLSARGESRPAQQHMQQALDMQRRLDGPKSRQVAQLLNNLGAIARRGGDLDHAETLLSEARDMRRELFGEDSLELVESLNNLAYVHLHRRNAPAAVELNQRVLAVRRQRLGSHHPLTVQSLDNLAVAHTMDGQPDRAEPLMWESLALHRELLGDNHPDLAVTLSNLGHVLLERGHADAAEPLLREALDIHRRSLVPHHPRIGQTLRRLGVCLADQRRFVEAKPLLLDARENLAAAFGPRHPETLAALRSLIHVYSAADQPEDAACIQAEIDAATQSQP